MTSMPDVMPEVRRSSRGRIGRYQIINTLGEGSFGKVKLAYHMATHARVALKIINRKTLAKSDMQGRVEREISYLRLLRHPHIIKLYDVIKSKDEIIMVIEFAGKELFEYIVQNGRISEKEARRFFQQIISAVSYCHSHKIVHRDLKPENLLLDDKFNVKIGDFGLSNIMTDGNFLKTSCGSPNYAAPEVISGKLYAGPEVDVWSSGVILYVMLCGRLPFDDEFIPVLFKKIAGGVYTLPDFLSAGAKHMLQRMLVVNPLNRITIQEIVQDPWFQVDLDQSLFPKEEEDDDLQSESPDNLDEAAIAALSRTLGYGRQQVIDAMRYPTGPGASEIRDAYKLLKDNRSAAENDSMDQYMQSEPVYDSPPLKSAASEAAAEAAAAAVAAAAAARQVTPTPGSSSDKSDEALTSFDNHLLYSEDKVLTSNTTIAILPTSLPTLHRAEMIARGVDVSKKKLSPISTKKTKTRWHFGIRSRSFPLDVMGEIYRALKNLGAEWAQPIEGDLWTIHVRWTCVMPSQVDDAGNKLSPGEPEKLQPNLLKMRIQLYQVEENNYLVDFKFDGWEERLGRVEMSAERKRQIESFSAYPFLHLSTRLIMELAVNSEAA